MNNETKAAPEHQELEVTTQVKRKNKPSAQRAENEKIVVSEKKKESRQVVVRFFQEKPVTAYTVYFAFALVDPECAESV
jgi:hypothetical protein